jgi:hypothetical protein
MSVLERCGLLCEEQLSNAILDEFGFAESLDFLARFRIVFLDCAYVNSEQE